MFDGWDICVSNPLTCAMNWPPTVMKAFFIWPVSTDSSGVTALSPMQIDDEKTGGMEDSLNNKSNVQVSRGN